jgi:hypothetical protein
MAAWLLPLQSGSVDRGPVAPFGRVSLFLVPCRVGEGDSLSLSLSVQQTLSAILIPHVHHSFLEKMLVHSTFTHLNIQATHFLVITYTCGRYEKIKGGTKAVVSDTAPYENIY